MRFPAQLGALPPSNYATGLHGAAHSGSVFRPLSWSGSLEVPFLSPFPCSQQPCEVGSPDLGAAKCSGAITEPPPRGLGLVSPHRLGAREAPSVPAAPIQRGPRAESLHVPPQPGQSQAMKPPVVEARGMLPLQGIGPKQEGIPGWGGALGGVVGGGRASLGEGVGRGNIGGRQTSQSLNRR